jgi:hypothetical protein
VAQHPFILEFPVHASDYVPITLHRRTSEHRRTTLLLNVLLAGRISLQPPRAGYFWATVPGSGTQWVQENYGGSLGECILDEPSKSDADQLQEVDPEGYYGGKVGHDGSGLRVPTDLDESICRYRRLPAECRVKFDRAAFWLDMASRQWDVSLSASFAALVSAIESLTERGTSHAFRCPICQEMTGHETPGARQRFKQFIEAYAPGTALKKRRNEMYDLRSGVLHGAKLMQLDMEVPHSGSDPPWWNELKLHKELWSLTQISLRNWLIDSSRV